MNHYNCFSWETIASYGMIHFSNRESSRAMAASAEEPVVAGSILERTEKDAETLDRLSCLLS